MQRNKQTFINASLAPRPSSLGNSLHIRASESAAQLTDGREPINKAAGFSSLLLVFGREPNPSSFCATRSTKEALEYREINDASHNVQLLANHIFKRSITMLNRSLISTVVNTFCIISMKTFYTDECVSLFWSQIAICLFNIQLLNFFAKN